MPLPDAQPAPSRVRRRLALALAVIAVLLVLVVTPPLVSVDRYRHRIVQTMSDSLGRPVHIDEVKLHLLPLPSLELRNVVVSEDPAFGAEPTIRANRVEAILRPTSLWRRRIEFSTIRFAADESGTGPSVNLVRNAAGRWNLDSVLVQAAHVSSAPTGQRKAGPAPRFPYIEATAARVNLKLGAEKMPFSLTEADFALWLPSPGQWRVRLTGRPVRTDVRVSETGIVRLEGTLSRAASMPEVPVDLLLTWNGAQLGEATTLLTGEDMGWRGTGSATVTLQGPLANAELVSTVDLHSLRRADFIPARSLNLAVVCRSQTAVTMATLENPVCSLPAPLPDGGNSAGTVQLQAARFDLTSRSADDLRFTLHASDAWLLDWARLLAPGIPPDENPDGAVEGVFTHIPASAAQAAFWAGSLQGDMTGLLPWQKPGDTPSTFTFAVTGSPSGFDLAPVNVAAPTEMPLALTGSLGATGYSVHLAGFTSPQHAKALADKLPPLGTGLDTVLSRPSAAAPHEKTAPLPPRRIDLTCGRAWAAAQQTCTSSTAEPAVRSRTAGHASSRRHR